MRTGREISLPVCVMKMCNSKTDATVAKECVQIQVVQTGGNCREGV